MERINYSLDEFKVIKKSESGTEEPYVWIYWILLDLVTLGNRQHIFKIEDPCQGNLGIKEFDEGQSVEIPSSINSFSRDIDPILGEIALTGMIIFAWEGDSTPNDKVRQAYNETADILNEVFRTKIETLNLEELTKQELDDLKSSIEDKIREIYSSAVHWYDPFSWDSDESIGFAIKTANLDEVPFCDAPFTCDFRDHGAHYRITGSAGMFYQHVASIHSIQVDGQSNNSIFTVFAENRSIYRSDDGNNLGGGGDTESVYNGNQRVTRIAGYNGHVITGFDRGGIYRSPDGNNLGGGGTTIQIYSGSKQLRHMIAFQGGLISVFGGGGVYLSPDGNNPGGGGNTERVYSGNHRVLDIIPFDQGVITAFSGGWVYYSPDGRNIGGGGDTVRVYDGQQTVTKMTRFHGGVLTCFSEGGIYLSPDGNNLGGGGNTERVYSGTQRVVSMIPYQNGVITAFTGKGIYRSPDGKNIGGGGATVRVYNGAQGVRAMTQFHGGVITAFELCSIFLSPDGNNLGGGGNTERVYPFL